MGLLGCVGVWMSFASPSIGPWYISILIHHHHHHHHYTSQQPNTQPQNNHQARLEAWQKAYDNQQKKIQEEKDFINRFRSNAARAPQVKSRENALEKLMKSDELVKRPPFQVRTRDGGTDGWMDGGMRWSMDGWMDGYTYEI